MTVRAMKMLDVKGGGGKTYIFGDIELVLLLVLVSNPRSNRGGGGKGTTSRRP